MSGMRIQLGYTPDADDVYMLHALLAGELGQDDWAITPVEAPVPELNDRASRGELEVSMLSAAAFALTGGRYDILPAGSTFGLGCGPVIVARPGVSSEDLAKRTVAIPGSTTTACAMLQLYCPGLRTRILPLDKLLPAVEAGLVDAALVIHEEFVTYRRFGLEVVVDLGRWWADTLEGLPMPVTCCAVHAGLPRDVKTRLSQAVADSIAWARAHHDEAIDAAMAYAHGADRATVERFIGQYVNDLSPDMGQAGRDALERFFHATEEAEILPPALPLTYVQADGTQV